MLFVWVAWLPWCMRIVWRALFWIGDGGWINWQKLQEQASPAAPEHSGTPAVGDGSPISTPLSISKDTLASAVVSHMANAFPKFLSSSSQASNFTNRDPILIRFAKKFMVGMVARTSNQSISFRATSPLNDTSMTNVTARPSWLSNFSFLKSLTPSPTFNNLLIDTLEGQLITLLVVIAFILIFLIREWVVQQQPGANIGAGPNANPPVDPGGEVPILERIARQRAEQRLQPVNEGQAVVEREARVELPAFDERERRIPAPQAVQQQEQENVNGEQPLEDRADSSELSSPESQGFSDAEVIEPQNQTIDAARRRSSVVSQSTSPQRPIMPKRNSMARAAEIRRTLEEQSRASGQSDWPGLKVFLELWNRAESKPSEVLKIIEEEGRNEELAWIVAAMRKLENAPDAEKDQNTGHHTAGLGNRIGASTNSTDGLDEGAGPSNSYDTQPAEASWSGNHGAGSENIFSREDFLGSEMGQAFTEHGIDGLQSEILSSNADRDHKLWPPKTDLGSVVIPNSDTQSARLKSSVLSDGHRVPDSSSELGASSSDRRLASNPFHPDYEGVNEHDENLAESRATSTNGPESPVHDEIHDQGEFEGPAGEDDLAPVVRLPINQNDHAMNQSLGDTIMNWLWGDINIHTNPPAGNADQQGGDDERIVDNLADEAPFVPVEDGHPIINDVDDAEDPLEGPIQDPEVLAAAVQAGLDPAGLDPNGMEAVEDVEDLEGIMELVGMQGPLAALIQNGMFCAILVSMTIFLGVWIPYIAGKLFLVFLANPISLLFKLPLRWASTSADLIIDLGVFSAGCAFYWVDTLVRLICAPVGWLIPPVGKLSQNTVLAETAKRYAESAMGRLARTFIATRSSLSESEIPLFSIIAHESLRKIEGRLDQLLRAVGRSFLALIHFFVAPDFGFGSISRALTTNAVGGARSLSTLAVDNFSKGTIWMSSIAHINPLRVSFSIPQRTRPFDYNMAYWNTKDRIIAIVFGYVFFSLIGALYIKIRASLRGRSGSGKVEGVFADVLYQAGGVLKVVLIISIEMIVFPLYCGLLLDIALLPLFGNVTILSRVDFLLASPNTSLFVHWFVGTCYMFHFALFVSMCRKIMRNGVLCKLNPPDFFGIDFNHN